MIEVSVDYTVTGGRGVKTATKRDDECVCLPFPYKRELLLEMYSLLLKLKTIFTTPVSALDTKLKIAYEIHDFQPFSSHGTH